MVIQNNAYDRGAAFRVVFIFSRKLERDPAASGDLYAVEGKRPQAVHFFRYSFGHVAADRHKVKGIRFYKLVFLRHGLILLYASLSVC